MGVGRPEGGGAAAAVLFACLLLAQPAGAAPPAGAASCTGCHAAYAGVATPVPKIAGLPADAITKAMQEFRSGKRSETVMGRISRGFSEEEVQAIAAWYSTQK